MMVLLHIPSRNPSRPRDRRLASPDWAKNGRLANDMGWHTHVQPYNEAGTKCIITGMKTIHRKNSGGKHKVDQSYANTDTTGKTEDTNCTAQ